MKYIESLREGERINEIYLCKVKQSALTKAGKPYDTLILQDKTGTLDAKIWEPGSVGIDEFDSLDYIAVMGDITSFQGNLHLVDILIADRKVIFWIILPFLHFSDTLDGEL